MIGIDIARMKRWFEKEYPTYAGTQYITVVDLATQAAFDNNPFMEGETIQFTVGAWDVDTKTCVLKVGGTYNRTHYGGWAATYREINWEPDAILVEDNNNEGNSGSEENTGTENPVDNSSEGGEG